MLDSTINPQEYRSNISISILSDMASGIWRYLQAHGILAYLLLNCWTNVVSRFASVRECRLRTYQPEPFGLLPEAVLGIFFWVFLVWCGIR